MTPPLGYEVPIAGFSWLFVWTALASAQGDLNTAGGRHRSRAGGPAATPAAATSSTCTGTAPAPRAARS